MFGRTPAAGRLPRHPLWSPDGSRVAYLRDVYDKAGRPRAELWLYHVEQKIENPVFTQKSGKISEYAWCDPGRITAVADGDLWVVTIDAQAVRITRTQAEESHPIPSPDGSRIAFLRDGDIYVLDLLSHQETRLTDKASAARVFGAATWLYIEEFDTDKTMGWSPDGKRLWFYDSDLSKVPVREIPQLFGASKKMSYPRPGEPNPAVRIAVVSWEESPPSLTYLATGDSSDGYLPRVVPHPDGRRLLVTHLDRLQTHLEQRLCPMNGDACETVLSEQDPRFINLQADPVFVNGGEAMLFLSERSGYAQIYRMDLKIGAVTPLTEGDWTAVRIDGAVPASGTLFFTANIEDPFQYRLYRMPLLGGEVEGVAADSGCHEVLFSPDDRHYLDTHSDLNRAPRVDIRGADGKSIGTLAAQDVGHYDSSGVVNDLFPIPSPNGSLNALLTRPPSLRQGARYPVLVLVYGGPHAQLARRSFHTTYQPFRDLLAQRGILVFTVDGRGSSGRGHDFESAIRLSLGKEELEDQLSGVEYLKSLPFTDPKRVGIFGWSYGGYMALNGLLRSSEFSMGIAVAPVIDWRWYDTAYTERYMQRPEDNPLGYKETALPPLAEKLNAPLLLAHGIADDNVHFVHSAQMFDALIAANKRFDAMFFPGKDHRIAGPAARVYLFSRILRFIEEHL